MGAPTFDRDTLKHMSALAPDLLLDLAVCLLHEAAGTISRAPHGAATSHLALFATLIHASAVSQRGDQPSLPISPAARAEADQITAAHPTPLVQLETAYEALVWLPLRPGVASLTIELAELIAAIRRAPGA